MATFQPSLGARKGECHKLLDTDIEKGLLGYARGPFFWLSVFLTTLGYET